MRMMASGATPAVERVPPSARIKHGEIRSPIETIRDNENKGDEEEPEDEPKRKKSEDKPEDGGELATDMAPAPA